MTNGQGSNPELPFWERNPIWERNPGGCLAAGCGFIVAAVVILSIAVAVVLL